MNFGMELRCCATLCLVGMSERPKPGRSNATARNPALAKGPRLRRNTSAELPSDALAEPKTDGKPAKPARPRSESGGVTVKGVDDVLVRFAKCCGPVPGDAIVGFITRGRGITVHARDCPNLAAGAIDTERTVTVEWAIADVPVEVRGGTGETEVLPVTVTVFVRGPREARSSGAQDFDASVDASGLRTGLFQLQVQVTPPERVGVVRVEPPTVRVRVR